jgi:hypothetical protein
MNQLTAQSIPESHYLSDQRRTQRQEVINLLAVTERGTGQILDISRKGISFGCLYPHTFPNEFYLDILDAKGTHIKKIKVRKIRETNGEEQDPLEIFELVVGVEFSSLSPSQSHELGYLLETMETYDYPYLQLI